MGNFHRHSCRPRNAAIFCVCEFCHWGLDTACKFWKRLRKVAGKPLILPHNKSRWTLFWRQKKLESCTNPIWNFMCWMRCFCRRISLCRQFLVPFYPVQQRACLHPNRLGLILKSCGLNHRNVVPFGCNTPLSARCEAISFLCCSQPSKWPIPADSAFEQPRSEFEFCYCASIWRTKSFLQIWKECNVFWDFPFFSAVHKTQSDWFWPTLIARVPAFERMCSDVEFHCWISIWRRYLFFANSSQVKIAFIIARKEIM